MTRPASASLRGARPSAACGNPGPSGTASNDGPGCGEWREHNSVCRAFAARVGYLAELGNLLSPVAARLLHSPLKPAGATSKAELDGDESNSIPQLDLVDFAGEWICTAALPFLLRSECSKVHGCYRKIKVQNRLLWTTLSASIWHGFAIGRNAELVLANVAMRKQRRGLI
jgi:hypothetical protein